ncbi:hypothetical protein IAI51_11275 [Pseudomonas sp. N40(2020)]|uniref:hypothetical protein n=1 Tax=Pseudomonas sp. N40(2020) TaxID=2767798 RepID=UPI00165730C1|nr:hypothetical protein [Pseudomonas sp. N40(2020)]MBC8997110.1 hypothetical protein [Pseudomonas sp. N40(2020)]
MPLKPPSKGTVTVDVHTRPRQTPDGQPTLPDASHRVDFGPSGSTPPRTPGEPGRTTLNIDADATSSALPVSVRETPSSSGSPAMPDQRPWADYLSKVSVQLLPPADAQGLRTFKGRRYVEVSDGAVHVGADPETGQWRAKLPSEREPSGPVLVRDADSRLWRPLDESGFPVLRSTRRKSSLETPLSDDEFELAMESLPTRSQEPDDVFEMASESMPIEPYSAQELAVMRQEVRYTSMNNQLGSYNRANNGKYPIRDSLGRPARIRFLESDVTIEPESPHLPVEHYKSRQIRPFIRFEGYEAVARLYDEKLQLRQFTEADMKVPGERALIGQSMVVANRRIAKGEVVGVYGGTIRSARFLHPTEQVYTMIIGMDVVLRSGQLGPGAVAIVGDNIISRMNTNFIYDATGKPVRQARDGYNVKLIGFNVDVQLPGHEVTDLKRYLLNTAFATEDIPAGTELRWDYNYTDEHMQMLFP